jgi:cysteine-rich repeat protein
MTSCRVPGGLVGGLAVLAVLPFVACSGPGPAGGGASDSSTDESTTSHEPDPSSTSPVTSSESDSDSASVDDSGDESSSSTTDTPMPVCGDAHVDPGEMCDDGNLVDGDGCDVGCVPSDPAQWSYVGGPLTSLRSLALADDGSVVAGGTWGNPWDFGSATALMRALDSDGELVAESDALVPGEAYVFDVERDAGGRFWLFGARVVNPWIYRIDGSEVDQINYSNLEGWASADFAEDGIAVSSFADVAWLDQETGDVVWDTAIGMVDDSALAPDDDVLVVGRTQYGDPSELRRFAPDGDEQGTAVTLDAMTYCQVGASAIGTAVVGVVDEATLASELRVFDDAGTMLWSTPLPGSQFFGVMATGEAIVLSGGVIGNGSLTPVAMAFAADGTELWTFAPDPADYGLSGGYLAEAELAPDGTFVFAGTLLDLATDPFEPPGHAFVIRRPS